IKPSLFLLGFEFGFAAALVKLGFESWQPNTPLCTALLKVPGCLAHRGSRCTDQACAVRRP
ncbi:hypothetical protein HAX54_046333, partial [Datura stramonium]|nr:hypothetical protein [Datura stramonium]